MPREVSWRPQCWLVFVCFGKPAYVRLIDHYNIGAAPAYEDSGPHGSTLLKRARRLAAERKNRCDTSTTEGSSSLSESPLEDRRVAQRQVFVNRPREDDSSNKLSLLESYCKNIRSQLDMVASTATKEELDILNEKLRRGLRKQEELLEQQLFAE